MDFELVQLLDSYNKVIRWIEPSHPNLLIADVFMRYLCDHVDNKMLQSHAYIARSNIAEIAKDQRQQLEYLVMAVVAYNQNEDAYLKIMNLMSHMYNVSAHRDLYVILAMSMSKTAPLYKSILYSLFIQVCHLTDYSFASDILKHFDCDIQRVLYHLYVNSNGFSSTREEEETNNRLYDSALDVALHSDRIVTFLQTDTIVTEKIGFFYTYATNYDHCINQKLARLYREVFPILKDNARIPLRTRGGKKRIGFYCTYMFKTHTMHKMFGAVLKHLDRNKFEVYMYHTGKFDEDLTPYFNRVTVLHNIGKFRDILERIKQIILDDCLDVIIYPEIGMEHVTYLSSMMRLAPVQMVWWGHPESQHTNIDYYIMSEYFRANPAHFSEKLIRMKTSSLVYTRPSEVPDINITREMLGIPITGNIYMCVQSLFKYSHDFDAVLQNILETDPNGYIVCVDSICKPYYLNTLVNRWIAKRMYTDRMVMMPRCPDVKAFLTLCQHATVLLDTFPFSGSTSHLECFSIGKVVITKQGDDLRGSLCSGLYRRLKIRNAPIAHAVDEYVAIACEMANNHALRHETEKQILGAIESFYECKEEIEEWNAMLYSVASGEP